MICGRLILISLAVCVIFLCPKVSAFEAKQVYEGQTNYVADFTSSDAQEIFTKFRIPGRYYFHLFQRSSTGDAIVVQFKNLDVGTNRNRGALVLSEEGMKVIDLPMATGNSAFFDGLTKAYSFEDEEYVFSTGERFSWKGKTPTSRLYIHCAPGSKLLALARSDAETHPVVWTKSPSNELFHVKRTDINIQRIFLKGNRVFVFGVVKKSQDEEFSECWIFQQHGDRWEKAAQIPIPRGINVLDLDPASANALCYKEGGRRNQGYLFDLESKKLSKIPFDIWRDNAYFMTEGLVKRIKSALRGGGAFERAKM